MNAARLNLGELISAREGGEIIPFPDPREPRRGRSEGRGPNLDPSWRKWLRALRRHGPRLAAVAAGLAAIVWTLTGCGSL